MARPGTTTCSTSLGLDTVELMDERELIGPNWKVAYDGYVDGYHLDILHKDTLGKDVMGNIMTVDAWGPHQRVAFARRNLHELRDVPRDEWKASNHMGLVHTVFPHVSVAGNGGTGMMVSQLIPGPTPDRSRTIQTHVIIAGADDEQRQQTMLRADFLEYVVTEEDYKTGLGIQAGSGLGRQHRVPVRSQRAREPALPRVGRPVARRAGRGPLAAPRPRRDAAAD